MDIDCLCNWWTGNHMKPNVSKTRVISFSRKTNMSVFRYIIFVGLLLFERILLKIREFFLTQSCIFVSMWTTYLPNH